MKVLLTGDWHIGVSQYGVTLDDGRNSRLADVEDVLHRVIKFACDDEIDLFLCSGDIFHTNRPSPEDQRAFFRILKHIELSDLNARFIIGNHDHNSKIGASHALKLFMDLYDQHHRIKIYDETTWESFEEDGADPLLVCFYPYHGAAPDWAHLASFGPRHATAVLCHSQLEGAVVGAEPFEIKGDNVTKFSEIPVDFVWAGHIHKPQILCDNPLAIYAGSIQCVDFNERNDVKGVVVFDTQKRTYQPCGFETRRFYQIDLVDTVEIKDSELKNVADAIVKININLKESDIPKFKEDKIRKSIESAGAHSIASINLVVERQVVVRNPEIKIDHDILSNFREYLKSKDYGGLTDHILQYGEEIINKCAL